MRRNVRAVLLALCLAACGEQAGDPSGDASSADGTDADGTDAGNEPSIDPESCFANLVAPDFGRLEIQRFQSEDERTVIWRARTQIDEPTVGETAAYALVRAWVETPTQMGACIEQASALDYQWAHHNWDETWSVRIGDKRYEGREVFMPTDTGAAWTDSLVVKDADDVVLEGPLALVDAGCNSLPYDLNVCVGRMRLDQPPDDWE